LGSLVHVAIGTAIGTPVGLLVGTYLAEYARSSPMGNAVRFVSDVLLSAPSILIGLFIYQLVVLPMGAFSGLAGSLALAIIVIPVVVRTTEDMLQLIPNTLREAVIGLGAPKWKMITLVCYKAALSGIVTGILLAVARIAGETAPLLLTSFGNNVTSFDLSKAMASLPIAIYQQANSGFPDLIEIAWAGALLITVGVLAINIVARVLLRAKI
jgi:phosphate transport system permease protein